LVIFVVVVGITIADIEAQLLKVDAKPLTTLGKLLGKTQFCNEKQFEKAPFKLKVEPTGTTDGNLTYSNDTQPLKQLSKVIAPILVGNDLKS
jgi:hypothetical protein